MLLCSFLVLTQQCFKKIAHENMKKVASNVAHIRPKFFFSIYCKKLNVHIGNWAEAPSVISIYFLGF